MDGLGSNQRTLAVDQWIEIVNGKGYGIAGTTQPQTTPQGFQPSSIPPPPGGFTSSTRDHAPWSFIDPETKRKKRIVTYKAYAIEGKVKATVKKGFRWIKTRCSQIVYG